MNKLKDRFFQRLIKVYKFIYRIIVNVTYIVITKKKLGTKKRISKFQKLEIKKYWKPYKRFISDWEYYWYKMKGVPFDVRLIPDTVWHTDIEPYYNNLTMIKGFQDKNYYETIIGKENSPETICRCINGQLLNCDYQPISIKEVKDIIKKEGEAICKPSIESGGGRGVSFISSAELEEKKLMGLKKHFKGNFVIQKIITQHDFLNYFNPCSVNTIRILSFLRNGEVFILSSFLRIGGSDSRLDNISSGGYFIQIKNDGRMGKKIMGEDIKSHDLIEKSVDFKFDFFEKNFPCWDEIISIVKKNHYKLAHFGIVNWDIALTKDSVPIVVEYNVIDASVSFHQIFTGPIFGDSTEEILWEVFKKCH